MSRRGVLTGILALVAIGGTSLPTTVTRGMAATCSTDPCRVEDLDPASLRLVTETLAGRRTPELIARRGDDKGPDLRELFRTAVRAVPFVVAADGTGSGVVVRLNRPDGEAWVVTNDHMVRQPFRTSRGEPAVVLLFYEPQMAQQPAEPEKLVACFDSRQGGSPWCSALRGSIRLGIVVGTDPGRDLALLHVRDVPPGVTELREAEIRGVQPGDAVAAIGHPERFLWSLTTGIVSAVRSRFRMGDSQGTVIQTQVPVWHGNSGGPLLASDGRLLGVISWGLSNTQGFNMAIAINEVQAFAAETAGRPLQR